MAISITEPRQVKLTRCAIWSPVLEQRALTPQQAKDIRNFGINIKEAVQSINIYESIWDNTISASIEIHESDAYPELFPLVGQEFVFLSFSSNYLGKTVEFDRTFRIRRLGNQTFPEHEKRIYTLELVTPEFFISLSSRLTKNYSKQTCSDAVHDIMINRLQIDTNRIVQIEKTDLQISAVIPNYTPLQAINFFAMLSLTKQKAESNFLFYETLAGFSFVSVASLIDPSVNAVATYEVAANKMSGQDQITELQAYNSILGLHQEQSFDVLTDITTGMLRSKLLHLDFFARTWKEEDSRYTESFEKTTHLDKYPLYPKNFDQSVDRNVKLFIVPTNTSSAGSKYALSVGEQNDENRLYQAIVQRNRQLRELKHLKTLLTVPGRPDLRAGSVINLIYPATRALVGASGNPNAAPPIEPTPYYSGRHLVTSVRHVLNQTTLGAMEYTMHLEAARDSLGAPLSEYPNDPQDLA